MWRHRCCVISHKLSNLSVPSLPDSAVSNAADFNSTCFMRPQPGSWKAKHRKPSMRFEAPGKAQLTVAENSSSSHRVAHPAHHRTNKDFQLCSDLWGPLGLDSRKSSFAFGQKRPELESPEVGAGTSRWLMRDLGRGRLCGAALDADLSIPVKPARLSRRPASEETTLDHSGVTWPAPPRSP